MQIATYLSIKQTLPPRCSPLQQPQIRKTEKVVRQTVTAAAAAAAAARQPPGRLAA
jgi:hypothetical protein